MDSDKQEELLKKIEEIKAESVDPEEIKELLIKLKEQFDKDYELCKDENTKEEIWETFIDDYFKEIEYRGEATWIYNRVIQHIALKRLSTLDKTDRYTYNEVMRKARSMEKANCREDLYPPLNIKEAMVVLVRSAMRYNPGISEKRIIQNAPEQKEKIDDELREKLISNIQYFARFINYNGFLDEDIEEANNILHELGLEDIKYVSRNPIPDEEYDENGNLVKDKEDIGVIDVFDTTFLEKLPIEDLILMNMAWEAQYFQKRLSMSRTLFTIDTLNLYETYMNGSVNDIRNIDISKIEAALKKEMALTYIYDAQKENFEKLTENGDYDGAEEQALDEVINFKLKRQYKKFLKENGLSADESIEEALIGLEGDFNNIYFAGSDISILQGIIIYLIKNKELKIKKWGEIDPEKVFEDFEKNKECSYIAIEHPGFRGPAVIEISKEVLEIINERSGIKDEIPKYKGYIDSKYCKITSKLCVPATQFYKNKIREKYKEQPSSKLIASLAGKHVKEER